MALNCRRSFHAPSFPAAKSAHGLVSYVDSLFHVDPELVEFGRYWRNVLGRTPPELESARSLLAVFAQTTDPDGEIQVALQLFDDGLTPLAST